METVRKLVNETAKADWVVGMDFGGGEEIGAEKVVMVVLSLAVGIAGGRRKRSFGMVVVVSTVVMKSRIF